MNRLVNEQWKQHKSKQSNSYPHCKIVSPRQIHHTCVVFLEMRQKEIQKYVPRDEMHPNRWDGIRAKYAEHVNWYECGWERIYTVVEQFTQWTTCASATCLLPIDTICKCVSIFECDEMWMQLNSITIPSVYATNILIDATIQTHSGITFCVLLAAVKSKS